MKKNKFISLAIIAGIAVAVIAIAFGVQKYGSGITQLVGPTISGVFSGTMISSSSTVTDLTFTNGTGTSFNFVNATGTNLSLTNAINYSGSTSFATTTVQGYGFFQSGFVLPLRITTTTPQNVEFNDVIIQDYNVANGTDYHFPTVTSTEVGRVICISNFADSATSNLIPSDDSNFICGDATVAVPINKGLCVQNDGVSNWTCLGNY